MMHSFDVEIATKYSQEKAVLIHNIAHWVEKNKANKKHFYDDKYWTYNDAEAFFKLFPYLGSIPKIRRILREMEDDNLIKSGDYNKNRYDRTKWYTLGENPMLHIYTTERTNLNAQAFKNERMSDTKLNAHNKETNINTDSKPNNKQANEKSSQNLQSDDAREIEENFFSFFWENYPKKTGKANCLKKYCVLLKNKTTRQKIHDEIMSGLSQYVSQKEDWCAWKNPLTFLNQKSWKDYTLDKPFEQQPQATEFLNWKDEAKEMENGRYVAGGWGAEVGESADQWRARFFAWKNVGLHNWWDKHNHCWTFTEQTKAQWLALHKKADSLMGVAA